MLNITDQQFAYLNDAMDDAFESRLVKVIGKALGEVAASKDGELRQVIRTSRERAATLNITADTDVAVFAAFVVAIARFNKEERTQFRGWIGPHLEREGSSGQVRIALAERSLRGKCSEHALAARMCAIVDLMRSEFSARTV
jgi:hypothetical protein